MRKYLFISCAMFLDGVLAHAQPPAFQNQQLNAGVVGLTAGQTARWNVLYPTAPAPILQPLCSVTLNIADDQGKILKTVNVSQFVAGKSISLDLNADTDLTGISRTEIHGFSVAPTGCNFTGTLELIDNITQKTVLVIGSRQTYPAVPCNWTLIRDGAGSTVTCTTVFDRKPHINAARRASGPVSAAEGGRLRISSSAELRSPAGAGMRIAGPRGAKAAGDCFRRAIRGRPAYRPRSRYAWTNCGRIAEGRRLDPRCNKTIGVFSDNGLETALSSINGIRPHHKFE